MATVVTEWWKRNPQSCGFEIRARLPIFHGFFLKKLTHNEASNGFAGFTKPIGGFTESDF